MGFATGFWPGEPANNDLVTTSPSFVIASTMVTTIAALWLLRCWLYPKHPKVIRGPLRTALPKLSKEEISRLDYVPDWFPGARDVETPYGSMRVYEWGPTTGRKVLLIHGITTSCQTLTKIAHGLVARGHRVMLFDLFGRGFSDGVGDLPHDARLYVTQVLSALASSPLSWLGSGGFDLVGYSLGGGIAVHFAAGFPDAVRSLILLAPAGMIRPESFGTLTRLAFTAGLVPERLLALLTRYKLQKPIASSAVKRHEKLKKKRHHGHTVSGYENGGGGKGIGNEKHTAGAMKPLLHTHPHPRHTNPVELGTSEVSPSYSSSEDSNENHENDYDPSGIALESRVMRYVRWMLANHAGFVPAFMACIRDGPLIGQDEAWKRVGLTRAPGTTCVILARKDEIIDPDLYAADALPLLGGPGRVRWRVVEGSHDFVMTHSRDALREIDEFWEALPPRVPAGTSP